MGKRHRGDGRSELRKSFYSEADPRCKECKGRGTVCASCRGEGNHGEGVQECACTMLPPSDQMLRAKCDSTEFLIVRTVIAALSPDSWVQAVGRPRWM